MLAVVWGQYSSFWVFIRDWNYFFCRNKNKHIAIFVFKNKCLLSLATHPFWPEISLFWPSRTFLQVSLSKPSKHLIRNKIKHGCSIVKWFLSSGNITYWWQCSGNLLVIAKIMHFQKKQLNSSQGVTNSCVISTQITQYQQIQKPPPITQQMSLQISQKILPQVMVG